MYFKHSAKQCRRLTIQILNTDLIYMSDENFYTKVFVSKYPLRAYEIPLQVYKTNRVNVLHIHFFEQITFTKKTQNI